MKKLCLFFIVLLAGCGSDVSYFTLRLIGSETVGGRQAISLDAVDEIRISIDPPMNIQFEMRTQMRFEDETVSSHVSTVGEFVVTLSREYIQRHATQNDVGFSVDIALTMKGLMTGTPSDPGLFVEFIQRNDDGTESIGTFRRALPWPLTDDTVETVTVACLPGFDAKCLNERP